MEGELQRPLAEPALSQLPRCLCHKSCRDSKSVGEGIKGLPTWKSHIRREKEKTNWCGAHECASSIPAATQKPGTRKFPRPGETR